MRLHKKIFGSGGNFLFLSALIMFIFGFSLYTPIAHTEDSDIVFDRVKAALIFKLTNFVTWPSDAFESDNSPLYIYVVENKTIYNELKKSAGNLSVNSHPVKVMHKGKDDPLDTCHILFIDESVSRKYHGRFSEFHNSSILTIGDDDTFAVEGGIIRISKNNNRPDLEVNIDSAKDSNLVISSQVLKLSTVVHSQDE